jgi:hypothetical protein
MNKQDKQLMEKFGITSATRTVFFYKEFKYDSLENALKYAKHDTNDATAKSPDK